MSETKVSATSKHAPGPWEAPETNQVNYMGDTFNAEIVYRQCSSDLVPVAFVPITQDLHASLANARIIAAAPELLAALEAMVQAFDGQTAKAEVWASARSAIAKAKGE